MTEVKFSIITCTRNSMMHLPQTVASVLMQQGVCYEHLFVDGNSEDGTLEYVQSLPGDVRLLKGVTGGISRAMNAGISASTGDVICHLHSDDFFLHPTVLSRVEHALCGSDAGWLFGRIMNCINGELSGESYVAPTYSYHRLLRRNFIPHPATFVRRAVFMSEGLFDEALRYAMDYEYWLRIGRKYQPAQISEPLTAFRRHPGSASESNRMAAFEEDHVVRRRYAPCGIGRLALEVRYAVRKRRMLRPPSAHQGSGA